MESIDIYDLYEMLNLKSKTETANTFDTNNEDDGKLKFVDLSELQKKKSSKLPEEANSNKLNIIAYPSLKQKIPLRKLMKEGVIPAHSSAVIFNGKAGSGKSSLVINLLTRKIYYGKDKNNKQYFDRIYLFSPTSGHGDDLPDYLNLPDKNIFSEFCEDTLINIIEEQQNIISRNKNNILKSPKTLILFDDIQSDQKFMNTKAFLKCFIMSRHLNISVWVCSQSLTKTPRACRLQCTNIFFFQGTCSEHKLIVDEYSVGNITKKQFQQLVNYATSDPYSFLHINMKQPAKTRFRKNLNEILTLKI